MAKPPPIDETFAHIDIIMPDDDLSLTPEETQALRRRLERLTHIANIMDSRFSIPGLPLKLGLDTLIGLIPGIGDTIGLCVSTYIISQAAGLGVSKTILRRMVFNVGIDWLIGLVPFIGDIFDMGWQANNRNIRLVQAHLNLPTPSHLPL